MRLAGLILFGFLAFRTAVICLGAANNDEFHLLLLFGNTGHH
jgi:hypothetical protein